MAEFDETMTNVQETGAGYDYDTDDEAPDDEDVLRREMEGFVVDDDDDDEEEDDDNKEVEPAEEAKELIEEFPYDKALLEETNSSGIRKSSRKRKRVLRFEEEYGDDIAEVMLDGEDPDEIIQMLDEDSDEENVKKMSGKTHDTEDEDDTEEDDPDSDESFESNQDSDDSDNSDDPDNSDAESGAESDESYEDPQIKIKK